MTAALDRWFIQEVLVHEDALMHYLGARWPRRDEIVDLRQEIYARVYEAAARTLPRQPRAFLFATARHLLADRYRRARVVSIEPMGETGHAQALVDELSPERWCGGRQVLKRLANAFDRLPARCREVVWLRRVEHLSQKEVALRLGIGEKAVEKHIARGMRLLADHYFGGERGADAPAAGQERQDAQRQAD